METSQDQLLIKESVDRLITCGTDEELTSCLYDLNSLTWDDGPEYKDWFWSSIFDIVTISVEDIGLVKSYEIRKFSMEQCVAREHDVSEWVIERAARAGAETYHMRKDFYNINRLDIFITIDQVARHMSRW